MIKLMMALVFITGDVQHVELKGSVYQDISECQAHMRQLSFTYNSPRGQYYGHPGDIVGGGFYCEVSGAKNP